MRKIISFILTLLVSLSLQAKKSPHGETFSIDCSVCHVTENWKEVKSGFDHSKTRFPLIGQHRMLSCRQCHVSLEFSKAKTKCSECHTDVHQGTTGNECERCHNTNSWLISNVKSIHQQAGFPLRGFHATADCRRCHTSASMLRFDNIRTDCYACHKTNYESTAGKPFDHRVLGFDTDCTHCHNQAGVTWTANGKGFDHSYFPLIGGHNVGCTDCHIDGDYRKKLSTDCNICHTSKKADATASLPAHSTIFAKYSCGECHTTLTWNTVKFKQHDAFFGIYSGNHRGVWTRCTDCHVNDAGFDAKNTCKRCHD